MTHGLPKNERLKGQHWFDVLFEQGRSIKRFPLKLVHTPVAGATQNLFGVSVPKRNVPAAVRRNRIKRQIREAYRLNKSLVDTQEFGALFFIYQGRESLPYARIEQLVKDLLLRYSETKTCDAKK
jgi:ribonuclease P protein component